MAHNNTTARSGGIGFVGMLTILFIGLKLTGVIDWSWWWVVSPLWISFLLFVGFMFVFLAIALIAAVIQEQRRAQRGDQR